MRRESSLAKLPTAGRGCPTAKAARSCVLHLQLLHQRALAGAEVWTARRLSAEGRPGWRKAVEAGGPGAAA